MFSWGIKQTSEVPVVVGAASNDSEFYNSFTNARCWISGKFGKVVKLTEEYVYIELYDSITKDGNNIDFGYVSMFKTADLTNKLRIFRSKEEEQAWFDWLSARSTTNPIQFTKIISNI